MTSTPPRILKIEFDDMPLPIFDVDAIELLPNEGRYLSGGFGATVDGSLPTWTVNIGVKVNRAI